MATRKKAKIAGTARVNVYRIMNDAVDRAVQLGYRRAHKHTDKPGEEAICEEIHRAVMSELCEYLIFDELEER